MGKGVGRPNSGPGNKWQEAQGQREWLWAPQGDGTHPTVPKCPGGAGVRLKVFRLLLLLLGLGSP